MLFSQYITFYNQFLHIIKTLDGLTNEQYDRSIIEQLRITVKN
jgi:hypothetical protein